jgi:putative transposase
MSQVEVDAITKRFKKALVERMLGGELTHIWAIRLAGEKPPEATNHRNGTSAKTVLTDEGPLTLDIPRDREGTFAPLLIGKRGGRGFRRSSRRGDARALT